MTYKKQDQQHGNTNFVSLEPLLPVITGSSQLLKVENEILISNDSLIGPLQPFPGAKNPTLSQRSTFPIPDRVGEYCSLEEFLKMPKYMAQWVHWPTRAKLILEGRYFDLPPAHFEGIFTLVCNFMCPHCSRRVTRTKWVDGGSWDINTPVNKRNTMYPEGLKRVLDQVSTMSTDGQMGIVWGGGDPTASPFTYDAMIYANSIGIKSSFLTNGVFLNVDRVLDSNPILVRVSLNCGTEESYRKFHGYPKGWNYFDQAKSNLSLLAKRKLERKSNTLVGVSLIADKRNKDDLVEAAKLIRSIVENVGAGIDYVIVRPVFNYVNFEHQWAKIDSETKDEIKQLIEEGGMVWNILHEVGVPLIPIKDSFDPPPNPDFYKDTDCLSYGIAAEIRHNGDVQLCSDSYGDPEYTIGNLYENNLREIWTSEKRSEVLKKINLRKCYMTACPHNSRGHHYNRIFHQIEELRIAGEMDKVYKWVNDLRETTLPLGHSFFI